MRSTWLSFVFLLLHSLSVDSFSRGSPEAACEEDMRPRHGFATQAGKPPAEIVVDQSEVRQDHYLRVTLRSTKPFKGFLLRADVDAKRNGDAQNFLKTAPGQNLNLDRGRQLAHGTFPIRISRKRHQHQRSICTAEVPPSLQ